ncbi:hypothetical protein [Pedobacter sp. NJ-S-72]
MGYQFDANWRLDVRGERFAAKNVESPSDIFFGNGQPSTKDIERHNEEATISGNIDQHHLTLKGYTSQENNLNNTLLPVNGLLAPYASYKSSTSWKGIQAKDAYQLGNHSLVFGLDYSNASTSSQSFNSDGSESAPYSPNYTLSSAAGYIQGQFNFLDNKLVIKSRCTFRPDHL